VSGSRGDRLFRCVGMGLDGDDSGGLGGCHGWSDVLIFWYSSEDGGVVFIVEKRATFRVHALKMRYRIDN
jgi:hypothetical protein